MSGDPTFPSGGQPASPPNPGGQAVSPLDSGTPFASPASGAPPYPASSPYPPASPYPPRVPYPPPGAGPVAAAPWGAGRIVALVAGCVLALIAVGMVVGASSGLIWSSTNRDGGYVTLPSRELTTNGYAIRSQSLDIRPLGSAAPDIVGRVRVRVTDVDPSRPVFVGIARSEDVDRYLAGVAATTVRDLSRHDGSRSGYHDVTGGAPTSRPDAQSIWVASAVGTGTQTVVWKAQSGEWTIVTMAADATAPLSVRADVGATIPILLWVLVGGLVVGVLIGVVAIVLIVVPVRRAGRTRSTVVPAYSPPPGGPSPGGAAGQ